MKEKIRVLVVDDSAFMRMCIKDILDAEEDIEVIDTARDGNEAVKKAIDLHPDVITLDINMPVMDGLTALQYIMSLSPCPVVIISSLSTEGALTTFEALELGAVDFVAKPEGTVSLGIKQLADEIIAKVKAAALSNREKITSSKKIKKLLKHEKHNLSDKIYWNKVAKNENVIIIGVSTGGPRTLMEILPYLPSNFPAAVIVVQHMPPGFTKSFAQRLDQSCNLNVKEAESDAIIECGAIIIAKGGWHLKVERDKMSSKLVTKLTQEPGDVLYKPSVNVTMKSVLENLDGKNIIGVLLTGMGDDGADMMVEIRKRGGLTIAESQETAIVYGMPREAIERGGAEIIAPAYKISDILIKKVYEHA
ncbi:protein-glutamate methylesterase/protein-glutamine glutaminase [Thermoanaerobacterium thermosaccharolyticum]|uniref:protein-glutamate methylesterase/protein-glutamine glutaminase n=1 Tax=Thermoanaerobacterium thermosaccharolyticum TaxID=1517 RepID=UPI0020A49BA2|nr:chemotaxis response regulator protein-glutamate methylesterase [Thermoanaerobacterium thermosaccharolyticum]MCP2238988.1 two-component system chemotaxis response regulator CheB [Thermoanaerobacterium thermosaccharolyticum]